MYQRKKRLLQASATRLAKPKLVASFVHWKTDWNSEMAANARMTHEERLKSGLSKRNEVEQELAKVRRELADARQAMLDGRGMEAEKERRMQEQLEQEREARVQHLANVGLRRMFQQGLARGFTAWKDQYLNYIHARRLLQQAGARLAKPKLAQAVTHWRHDMEAARLAAASETMESKLAASQERCSTLEAELAKAISAIKSLQGAAAEMDAKALERKKEMADELEAEKQKRVEHLVQVGVRRIFQQGLARGWTAWHDPVVSVHEEQAAARSLGRPVDKAEDGRVLCALAEGLGDEDGRKEGDDS